MRLFLAIDPDETVRQVIAGVIDRARHALGDLGSTLKWSQPGNVHVTLHFLGEVDAARLPALDAALAPACERRTFAASTGRIGAFADHGAPRVIWLAIDSGAGEMTRLHEELALRLHQVGLSTEDRPFVPHFTLARVRDRDRRRGRRIAAALEAVTAGRASWAVERVTLFKSDVSGGAPKYEPLLQIPLSGATHGRGGEG